MKRCTKCGHTKSLDNFQKSRANKDGLQYRCRSCNTIEAAKQRAKKRRNTSRLSVNPQCSVSSETVPSLASCRDYDPHVSLSDGYEIRDGRGQTISLESWTELSVMSMAVADAVDGVRLREHEEQKQADEAWRLTHSD